MYTPNRTPFGVNFAKLINFFDTTNSICNHIVQSRVN